MMSQGRGGQEGTKSGYGIDRKPGKKVGARLIPKGLSSNMTWSEKSKLFGLLYQHKGQT